MSFCSFKPWCIPQYTGLNSWRELRSTKDDHIIARCNYKYTWIVPRSLNSSWNQIKICIANGSQRVTKSSFGRMSRKSRSSNNIYNIMSLNPLTIFSNALLCIIWLEYFINFIWPMNSLDAGNFCKTIIIKIGRLLQNNLYDFRYVNQETIRVILLHQCQQMSDTCFNAFEKYRVHQLHNYCILCRIKSATINTNSFPTLLNFRFNQTFQLLLRQTLYEWWHQFL